MIPSSAYPPFRQALLAILLPLLYSYDRPDMVLTFIGVGTVRVLVRRLAGIESNVSIG